MNARTLLLFSLIACGGQQAPTQAPATVAAPAPISAAKVEVSPADKPESSRTVLDIALLSPDHTTLVAAVKAAGVGDALGSPGGIYTVFAPTNEAFAKLPPGTVDELLKPEKHDQLKAVVQHHAMVPILETSAMTDGQKLSMADGTSVTVHVADGKVSVDDANIIATVHGMNGVVHVVDAVLLPPAK